MRYFLIRDSDKIYVIHKTRDSAYSMFHTIIDAMHNNYLELVCVTTDEIGKVVETLLLQSYSKDSGIIIHLHHNGLSPLFISRGI